MEGVPQVLLLGNGLNIAYGGVSWNELLKRITVNRELLERKSKEKQTLFIEPFGSKSRKYRCKVLGEKHLNSRECLRRIEGLTVS